MIMKIKAHDICYGENEYDGQSEFDFGIGAFVESGPSSGWGF